MEQCERCGKNNPKEIHTCTPGLYLEKENTTGQTVYEQLQKILNECIELGWRPRGYDLRKGQEIFSVHVTGGDTERQLYAWVTLRYKNNYNYGHSINDLFSKDSGIMEFVEWRYTNDYYDKIQTANDYGTNTVYVSLGRDKYHYMIMSMLTAEQKAQYFVENAIIPSQK